MSGYCKSRSRVVCDSRQEGLLQVWDMTLNLSSIPLHTYPSAQHSEGLTNDGPT